MKHLFIDDHEIEAIDNLARKLQKARDNVVVRPEYRWENNSIQIRTRCRCDYKMRGTSR